MTGHRSFIGAVFLICSCSSGFTPKLIFDDQSPITGFLGDIQNRVRL